MALDFQHWSSSRRITTMLTPKSLIALSAIACSLLTGSAVAGPDWSIIERARATKQTEKAEMAGNKRVTYSYGPRAPYSPPPSPPHAAKPLPAAAVVVDNAAQ